MVQHPRPARFFCGLSHGRTRGSPTTIADEPDEEVAVKPPPFHYAAPTSVAEAVELMAEHADDEARVLAGGQSLVPLMNFRLAQPTHLIDLRRIEELTRIRTEGDTLVIGAMVRQATAEHAPEVALGAPLLAEALGYVAHTPIRNSGTVGGSIAHADPAAELPAVVLALDAELVVAGPRGARTVAAADFFRGPFSTAIGPGEILTEVRIPRKAGGHAFVEFARTHGSFALVGVAAVIDLDGDAVADASIALSGVAPTPVRATAAEQALTGAVADADVIRSAADADALSPAGDVHGGVETRIDIARSYLRRGIELALQRAQDRR
jgi:carbon-monoxide dehydrogenase medium subunit